MAQCGPGRAHDRRGQDIPRHPPDQEKKPQTIFLHNDCRGVPVCPATQATGLPSLILAGSDTRPCCWYLGPREIIRQPTLQ